MIDLVKKYIPDFDFLAKTEITDNGRLVGYHVNLHSNKGLVGGGTATTLEEATQIAVAESLERRTFIKLNQLENKFLTKEFPTSCGFAAGFDLNSTKMRSICEAVERWAWEQWIDKNCKLEMVEEPLVAPLARHFLGVFDSHIFLEKRLALRHEEKMYPLKLGVFLGVKDDGVFPGSRVIVEGDDLWTHSITEGFRHLQLYKDCKISISEMDIIDLRINYFGRNKEKVFEIIKKSQDVTWRSPELMLCSKVHGDDFYVFRSLCKDFWGWQNGSVERFIY